jgi:serine/threonine protein kinase
MEMCFSANIVEYHFAYYYKESLFMFIEYMDAGSLTNFIKVYAKKIP